VTYKHGFSRQKALPNSNKVSALKMIKILLEQKFHEVRQLIQTGDWAGYLGATG